MCTTGSESANSYTAVTLATMLDIVLGETTWRLSGVVPSVSPLVYKLLPLVSKHRSTSYKNICCRAEVCKLSHK